MAICVGSGGSVKQKTTGSFTQELNVLAELRHVE